MEKTTYKIWAAIEKRTVHADGSETYEDIDLNDLNVAESLGTVDTVDEAIQRMRAISGLYNHDLSTDKQTFILGYLDPSGEVVEFTDIFEANFQSEEWCRIKSDSLEVAVSRYDECYELLKSEGLHHQGVEINNGELEVIYSSF